MNENMMGDVMQGMMVLFMNLKAQGIEPPSPDFLMKYCNIRYRELVNRVLARLVEYKADPTGKPLGNPLYDEWKRYHDIHRSLGIEPGKIKYLFLCRMDDPGIGYMSSVIGIMLSLAGACADRPAIDHVAWAVPTKEVLDYMLGVCRTQKRDLVEIGAGKGYWLHQLQVRSVSPDFSVNCFGYDMEVPKEAERYAQVRKGDHRVMRQHKGDNVLLCWPPGNKHTGIELSALIAKHCEGDLFYIGEPSCHHPGNNELCTMSTATIEFFHILEDKWKLVQKIALPKWPTICDDFYHYRRKDST